MKNVEIFKVGKWRDSLGRPVNVDNAMVDQIVENFASLNSVPGYNVPIKLGHNDRVGEPAYGWVSDLRNEDGVLTADFADMDPAIVDAISKRRYNTVSIELAPKVQFGDKTFRNVLSGVALLGAEWPAVKGLKPLSASKFAMFATGGDETIRLGQEEMTLKFTQEDADALVLAAETRVTKEYETRLQAETGKVTAAEQRATIAETALASFRDEKDKSEVDAIIELAATAGKLTPANKEKASKFAERILKNTKGDERKSAIAEFKELVAVMAPAIKFGEQGKSKQTDGGSDSTKASDEIATEANKLMAADTTGKLDFAGAVQKVLASNDDLRQRYAAE
jgi:hypothetical protein